jgi:hypothetical protein
MNTILFKQTQFNVIELGPGWSRGAQATNKKKQHYIKARAIQQHSTTDQKEKKTNHRG